MRPIDIEPTRPIRTPDRVEAPQPVRAPAKAAGGERDVEVVRRELPGAGDPPIDNERVEAIKQALADGRFPLIPAKTADAMIAAKLILRKTP